jgi:hypothetical protein
MGVTLIDQQTGESVFDINFWHWRAIVEAIRGLEILPVARVDGLHEPFVGELTEVEARSVAAAMRARLLPTLRDDERLLLDGTRTREPDDGTFHRDPADQHLNYSTNRAVLDKFVAFCEICHGFNVA